MTLNGMLRTAVLFLCLQTLLVMHVSCSLLHSGLVSGSLESLEAAKRISEEKGGLKEPIFLTPFIDDFRAEEARNLSRVESLPSDPRTGINGTISYAGLITVNKKLNTNLFFWFFPSSGEEASTTTSSSSRSAPLILWLEGGPGVTSLSTLFNGNGPFLVRRDGTLDQRTFSWTKFAHMIYVDSPVGTGYSFTEDDVIGYSRNSTDAAQNLYTFLDQFLWMFPEYQSNELYIAASSYAGKDAAVLAAKIHENGVEAFINFQGILITNPFIVPIIQTDYYADYFYQNGLINVHEFQHFKREQSKIRYFLRKGNPISAYRVYDELIGARFTLGGKSYFHTVTGYSNFNNIQDLTTAEDVDFFKSYVTRADVRDALHVGSIPFHARNDQVAAALIPDFMTSVDRQLSEILGRYRVAFVSGNLDVLVPAASVPRAVGSIRWRCQEELRNADKEIGVWSVDQQQVIGHLTNKCDTYVAIIRNAGSHLIHDQQEIVYTLVQMFTNVSLPLEE